MDEHIDLYDELTADFENPLPLPTPIPDPILTPIPNPIPLPSPIPFPLLLRASGLYEWVSPRVPAPTPGGLPIIFPRVNRELRLDVDGNYPQMTVSGTESSVLFGTVQWIAKLAETESDTWEGDIYYKDGGTFAYTHVKVEVTRSFVISGQKAKVTLSGGSSSDRVLNYKFKSRFFHAVEFEFDCTSDSSVISSIETHAHPNRPASLPSETLTIQKVFQRAGFQVTKSGGDSIVPIIGAGADARWSDAEMHDAMQTYWSRFDNRPQWSLWTFFAALHEEGSSLGGIMFDDIGPNHRQGTAIFNNAFISVPPSGDAAPDAWVQRMRFWTACHEMGHSFNLAHSWQKQHPPEWGTPWIPLTNEPEVRSFMNYPFNVAGGQAAFFANFEYRFSDSELVFLRHAPSRFVEMGNANWFDHHGFEDHDHHSAASDLTLQVRVNRPQPLFEFLEPVVVELKLTNTSTEPQLVSDRILSEVEHMTVIIKRDKQPARQFLPYAKYCWQSKKKVLQPGESVYESLFISAGRNGWDVAEPGYYTIQVALHSHDDETTVISNPLRLRVAPPRSYEEEFLAQDFFSESVGRILAFDGSRVLSSGNDTLQQVVEQLNDRRVRVHAQVALGSPLVRQYKHLVIPNSTEKLIQVSEPNLAEAQAYLGSALASNMNLAAETLGHIDCKYYVDRFSDALIEQNERQQAQQLQGVLYNALANRKVSDRVLRDIKQRQETL